MKINKTFLGDGDNSVYATIRDSSEYKEEDFARKVIQQIHDGNVVAEFDLIAKEVSNKSVNGVFYAPLQTVYYFIPKDTTVNPHIIGLDEKDQYKILLQFTDGREVSATTNIIDFEQFAWQAPQAERAPTLTTTNSGGVGEVNYNQNVTVRWNPALNAVLYDLAFRFVYTEEVYASPDWSGSPISTTIKHLDYSIGATDRTKIGNSGYLDLTFNGKAFYTFVENSLEKNPNIRRVLGEFTDGKTRCFELHLGIGNEVLADYISVNKPSTGIVQEKPIYTNVSNGIGLFAGRSVKISKGIPLISPNSNGVIPTGNLDAFFQPGIIDLNFCDPNPASDHYCGQ